MRLLFDNNLSHRLASRLADRFPGSTHVMSESMDEADDQQIWQFAQNSGFVIVTKDSDYQAFSLAHGSPPK